MRGSPVRVRLSAHFPIKESGYTILALFLAKTLNLKVEAELAQLVEHWLPKPRVAGSSPVFRSQKEKNQGKEKKVNEKFAGFKK